MHEFTVEGPITLAARVGAGELTVTAEPRETATVEVSPYDSSDTAREAAERTRVELTGDVLTVEAPRPGWRLRRTEPVRVDIRLPEDCRLDIQVAAATVRLAGRYGDTAVHTASGELTADHVAGALDLETASGDAQVARVQGPAKARTASGDLALGYVGGDITAVTASGDVVIDRAAASVRARVASGDVRIAAVRQGTVEIGTASGNVQVGVEAGTRAWLDVSTTSGMVRSDLDPEPASGQADDGAPLTVRVRTASGNVELRRVPADVSHV